MSTQTLLSTLVLGDKPALVVDVQSGRPDDAPLSAEADPLIWSFLERGLRLLPGFLGVPMADDGRVRLLARDGQVTVVADDGTALLAVPIDDLPVSWLDNAQTHGGALLFVGRGIAVAAAEDAREAAQAIHAAAVSGRVVGGILALSVI